MKYAAYDLTTGSIVGFFDDSINSDEQIASQKTIQITDDEWQACIDNPGQYSVNVTSLALVEPSATAILQNAQAAQTALISHACGMQIQSGFECSALGAAYLYPLDLASQSNLQAVVIRLGVTTPAAPTSVSLMCADASNAWARRAHTGDQVMQVALEAFGYIDAVLAKKDALVAQIQAATTEQQIEAVVWQYP